VRSANAYADLLKLGRPIVETGEAATRLGLSTKRTSELLGSLQAAGLARRVRHGLWALNPTLDPFAVPPYLTAPFPAYVSVWSALARHGMIEQIPRTISVCSTVEPRRTETSFGVYEIHHLVPELFDGYTGGDLTGYLATPEKALFDTVYLRAPQGGPLRLPELELPHGFDADNQIAQWVGRIARPRLQTLVSRGLAEAINSARIESTE
jgi:predicted transcriptional regulator of viral defense system